ncbi:MAG: HAD family hydrolase [Planctomycetes bacterium]|nr:HAD family hydrolase [Planctomycetota bacterium]
MIRAVTFDLWETLIHEESGVEADRRAHRLREIGRVLAAAGVSVAPDALSHAHETVFARLASVWNSNLDVSVLEQTQIFLELALGPSALSRLPSGVLLEAARIYGGAAIHHPPSAVQGAMETLKDCHDRGLRLALICNTGRTPGKVLRDLLHRMGLRNFFDALFFSDELRQRKPAPSVFQKALFRLGVPPGESLHLGDRIESDLAGARNAGMITTHLRRPGGNVAPDGVADHVIADLREFPALLDRLGPPRGSKRRPDLSFDAIYPREGPP